MPIMRNFLFLLLGNTVEKLQNRNSANFCCSSKRLKTRFKVAHTDSLISQEERLQIFATPSDKKCKSLCIAGKFFSIGQNWSFSTLSGKNRH